MRVATGTALLLDLRVPVHNLATRVILCGQVPVDTPSEHGNVAGKISGAICSSRIKHIHLCYTFINNHCVKFEAA
jgi:hypothetical protein